MSANIIENVSWLYVIDHNGEYFIKIYVIKSELLLR